MGEWLIYGSNGSQRATVKKLEYSGEFMGETSVTCDVYSPSPISFSIGDYLVYRGERFTIDYDATRLKQARSNTYGKGYTYENMRFLSYVGELKKCEFLDFVPNDNLIHFSQLPDFSFYAETVNDLADRIQANLDRIYTGGKAWTVQVVQGFEGKENINVSVSKSSCFDALRMAYEQFEATFIIRGRTITIGTAGNELETDFRYGKGNGLKTIERSVDESDAIVTRLRAYGNTTNMPANYYKNIGMQVYAPIYEIYHVSSTGCDIHFVPKLKNACFNDRNGQYQYWITVSLDKSLWLKAVVSPNTHLSSTNYSVVTVGLYDGNTQAMVTQFNTQLQSGTYSKLYFKNGINVGAWPVEYREYAENVPDLMAIDRLMLPGFPELTTDPYIDSSNIATLGVREKSVYFDGTDPDTPDIHPTLEGMTAAELRAAGYVIDLDSGDNGNLDEIAADATETDGSPITADGAFEGVDEVPGFKVTIKDIGFDINDYLSTETATLVMKTGMCGGREFTIVNVDKVGNKYVLECQRTEDVAHYFPYNPYLIKAGDKFVLTNLEMPKAYIDAASQRLLTAAQEYIAKYSEPQWVYAIKMDDIWMQKQRDNSVSEASSYYWNIKEGDVMNVTDSDLGVDIAEVIDRLSIREGFGPIPEFEVVLRKEKPQGTIGVLQNRIRQLELRNAEQVSTIYRQQNYIDLIIGDKLNTIQEQLDHVQVTYFGEVVPTTSNYPASSWNTDALKEQHVFDMYYDKVHDKGYEWKKVNNTYQWVEITDPNTLEALRIASNEQDTIDGKRRIFVTPAGTLPTPPYDENDLWVNATYPSNSTTTDESQGQYYNDILKCITAKAEGGTASINDWTLASKYTDDSSLNAFINGSYADDLQDIQNQIDGKAETWYQSTDPSTAWTTTALKNQHKGDIWHNSSNTTINGVKAGQDAIWNGTAWVVDETVPQSVYDTIDGKAAIYVTWGAWGNDLQVKDLFIPSANTTQGGVTYKANKVYRCTNASTPTFVEVAYTDDTTVNTIISQYGSIMGITTPTATNVGEALGYLRQVLQGTVTTDGGLILANMLVLKNGNTVMSGINGQINSTLTDPLKSIAFWAGGSMKDKEVYTTATDAAKILFRFDGTGYLANGNIKWNSDGSGSVAGGNIAWNAAGQITTLAGQAITATSVTINGSAALTQSTADSRYVTIEWFNKLFQAYSSTTISDANKIMPNASGTINNLKLMVGTWTEQYLSALGLNSSGGGGGGGTVTGISLGGGSAILPDSSTGIVAIPAASSSAYGVIKVGSTLAISSGTLNLKTISGLNTTNYYTKYKVDSYGRVTTQSPLAASDIPDLSATYLSLSGGTLTGTLTALNYSVKFDVDTSRELGLAWLNTSGTRVASVTYHNTAQNIIINPIGSDNTYSDAVGKYSLFIGNDKLTYNTYTILHSNNYSSYALPLSGGTMTGTLKVDNITASNSNGLLTYKPSDWTGVSNTQWGVGAADSQGVIRSSDTNLIHYRHKTSGTTAYVILDASNYTSYTDGRYYALYGGTDIDASSSSTKNLNTYTTVGSYYLNLSANAQYVSNKPSTTNAAFRLWVTASTGTSDNYRRQRFQYYNSVSAYERYTNNNGSSWTNWYAVQTDLSQYLLLSGGTMTGKLNMLANQYNYTTDSTSYGLNMNNSDIVGVNGIFTSDTADAWTEGINFKRTDGKWDSLRAKDGIFYFGRNSGSEDILIDLENRAIKIGGTTSATMTYNTTNPRIVFAENGTTQAVGIVYTDYNAYRAGKGLKVMDVDQQDPDVWFEVGGNFYATGEVTASSDARLKDVLGDTPLSVKQIALAPSIRFEWKEKKDKVHIGSIAQYWNDVLPESLSIDGDGYFSLNYGALALCSAITIAEEVVKHEDEITRLKKEVVKLRERVAELEERRIA